MATLQDMIREARIAKGLTQYELADQIGVKNIAVSSWERGINNPSPKNMLALIDALGMDQDAVDKAYLAAWRR